MQPHNLLKTGIISSLLILLGACVSTEGGVFGDYSYTDGTVNANSVDSLQGLKTIGSSSTARGNKDPVNAIRRSALQEAGLSVGAQAGLASRAETINKQLEQSDRSLSVTFNFNGLMLEDNVLPPVLVEGQSSLNLDDPDTIRLVNRTYKIAQQARFVTAVPHWREYLWQNYQRPAPPDNSLLPKNAAERSIWDAYVTRGWENGIRQANSIFAESLARLKQDYIGMALYGKLLAQHMVSAPYVAHSDLGVTGDSNEIHINDRVLRITAHPGLEVDSAAWEPIISSLDNAVQLDESIERIASGEPNPNETGKQWQSLISSKTLN